MAKAEPTFCLVIEPGEIDVLIERIIRGGRQDYAFTWFHQWLAAAGVSWRVEDTGACMACFEVDTWGGSTRSHTCVGKDSGGSDG